MTDREKEGGRCYSEGDESGYRECVQKFNPLRSERSIVAKFDTFSSLLAEKSSDTNFRISTDRRVRYMRDEISYLAIEHEDGKTASRRFVRSSIISNGTVVYFWTTVYMHSDKKKRNRVFLQFNFSGAARRFHLGRHSLPRET